MSSDIVDESFGVRFALLHIAPRSGRVVTPLTLTLIPTFRVE